VNEHNSVDKTRAAALRLLTQRPRSVLELKERLSQRFPPDAVDEVVSALAGTSLLDDAEFARWWTESRTGTRPMAASMIARELAEKGIDGETVAVAIADVDDAANARTVARKAVRSIPTDQYDRFARRLLGRLARRGYSSNVCRSVVQEAWSGTMDGPDAHGRGVSGL
jgi:regulatory protein